MDIEQAIERFKQARIDKERAMSRAVMAVERAAKKRTPVDTGHLRRSITHKVELAGERGLVGTNVEYSSYVHEGTDYMAARPYLKQGLEDARQDVIDALGGEIETTLGEVTR